MLRRRDHPVLTDGACLAGAAWAAAALALTRPRLRRDGVRARIPWAPPLPARAVRGVSAALSVRRATCLERSLLLQRWLCAHGREVDVLVGVTSAGAGFAAHAWLDGLDDDGGHKVLHRLEAARLHDRS